VRKLGSIKILLQAVTGLMALALIAVFASSAERAYRHRVTAEHVHAVVSISRDLFMAMQTIRVERGTVNASIETTTPIDDETRQEVTALRVRSNTALDSALAKVKEMGIPASDPGLAQIVDARSTFDRIRANVDAALEQPKNQRLPGLSGLWIAGGGRLVDTIDAFSERLSGEINQADPLITEMMKIKQVAWVVRDAAGIDRLNIGALIAKNAGVTPSQQLQSAGLAGRIDAGWQVISEDERWLALPPQLKAAIDRAQSLYFDQLRAQRKNVLASLAAGQPAITGVEWVNLSNPGLEAIMNVANIAYDLSDDQAAREAALAMRNLVGALALTLFFFGFGAFATWFVIRRIAEPMARITAAMRAVADGDSETDAPYTGRDDEIGELARTLAVFRDKDRENRRMAIELLRQERLSALGQLTATVAHELRNPLSAIRNTVYTFKELAASKGLNLDRPIERVERSVGRCDRIIGELLDYTRVRDLHRSTASFDKWLDEVLNDQKLASGVTLVRNLTAPDHAVNFDTERMRQVVINLIDNAAQAMTSAAQPSDNSRIVVTTAARFNGFELVIADNGPGIPADVLPRVFEPLFSTKSFGTGLGLPMVKQVIEQHGGTVEITSTPGKGTKVTVRLPHIEAQEIAA
jgi:signal transduction histidine kinase